MLNRFVFFFNLLALTCKNKNILFYKKKLFNRESYSFFFFRDCYFLSLTFKEKSNTLHREAYIQNKKITHSTKEQIIFFALTARQGGDILKIPLHVGKFCWNGNMMLHAVLNHHFYKGIKGTGKGVSHMVVIQQGFFLRP